MDLCKIIKFESLRNVMSFPGKKEKQRGSVKSIIMLTVQGTTESETDLAQIWHPLGL